MDRWFQKWHQKSWSKKLKKKQQRNTDFKLETEKKVDKDEFLQDTKALYETKEENIYESIKNEGAFNNKYIEYESNNNIHKFFLHLNIYKKFSLV